MSSSKAKSHSATNNSREKRPGEAFARAGDVCQKLDIQPYVLKFWEGEFSQLGKRVGSKRRYDSGALAMAEEIRRLLQEEKRTLGDVRGILASRFPDQGEASADTPSPPEPAADSDEDLAGLKQKIAVLAGENRDLRRAAAESNRHSLALSEARNEVVELQREVERQRRRAERLQEAETRTRELEAEARRLRKECAEAKKALAQLREEAARAKETAKTLEQRAEHARTEAEQARLEVEVLKGEVAGLAGECERLSGGEETMLELRERLALAENSESALRDEYERAAADLRAVQKRERDLRSAIAKDVAEAVESINALTAESEALLLLLGPVSR